MYFRITFLAAALAAIASAPAMSTTLMAAPASSSPQEADSIVAYLAGKRSADGLDTDHGYLMGRMHPGVAGTRVFRINHSFKGVRIWNSESVVVVNDRGAVISEVSANFRQSLGKKTGVGFNVQVKPKLSANDAISLMSKTLAPNGVDLFPPTAELVIYPVLNSVRNADAINKTEAQLNALDLHQEVIGYELAYLVQTRMTSAGKPVQFDTLVSAMDGHVLKQFSATYTAAAVVTGKSQYSGVVGISADLNGGIYTLKDTTRGTGGIYFGIQYGGNAVINGGFSMTPHSVYSGNTNTWGDGKNYISGSGSNSANGQTVAVDAMWGMMKTYDMLKNTLGWRGIDGQNTAIATLVHVRDGMGGSWYNKDHNFITIGDGDATFNAGSSIDVMGHEMGHAVAFSTAGLTYEGESGGLNEAHADITGEVTEAYVRGGATGSYVSEKNDWLIGKEIGKTADQAPIRWMYKPSKDGLSVDAWRTNLNILDVHYSSGPANRMFYFLSKGSKSASFSNGDYYSQYLTKIPAEMAGVGIDKAWRIWFKTVTTKLTASSNYADLQPKMISSAQELYGIGSLEEIAVRRAFAAVNVGTDVNGGMTISTAPSNAVVALGAQASFSLGITNGTAPFYFQWYRNGVAIPGATSATYAFTPTLADSGAIFKVSVRDSAITPATFTSEPVSLTVLPQNERLVNGGFELGSTGWAGNVNKIFNDGGAHEGTTYAYLGGNGSPPSDPTPPPATSLVTNLTEVLYQDVAIPVTATSVKLSFALRVDTAEPVSATKVDILTVSVKDTAGNLLRNLGNYSNQLAHAASGGTAGYSMVNFDLTEFKGKSIRISFSEIENSQLATGFSLDKISLLIQ